MATKDLKAYNGKHSKVQIVQWRYQIKKKWLRHDLVGEADLTSKEILNKGE